MLNSQELSTQFQTLSQLPALRQAALLVGLAAAVAVGVATVLWSQEPSYRVLYPDMSLSAQARAMDALQGVGIQPKLGDGTGALMVPAADVHRARLELATAGLPDSGGQGYDLLDEENGFGTSRRMETARLQRVLEGELARSIGTLRDVEQARIHLALPERSVFLRDQASPSASVVLKLYAGRMLGGERIAGIRNLVASSVPEMEVDNVSVLDHKGELLSQDSGEGDTAVSGRHLAMTRDVEQTLVRRIERIVAPIVGADAVRAQVALNMDFTRKETTRETYNPGEEGRALVRSERLVADGPSGENGAQGVPGALTNTPPEAGTIGEEGEEAAALTAAQAEESTSHNVTRNYELNRRIEHEQAVPGTIRRLSVAVLVNESALASAGDDAETETPPKDEALAQIEALAREAVGFEVERGDSIRVSSAAFSLPAPADTPTVIDPPLWEQPMLWDGLRQLLGVLVLIVLLLAVMRPVMKGLANPSSMRVALPEGAMAKGLSGPSAGETAEAEAAAQPGPDPAEQQLNQARALVEQDPRRVAQLTRAWIGGNEQ